MLDLFCGAGGSAKGYQRAGFYVVGVDIKFQPRYCGDEFVEVEVSEFFDNRWGEIVNTFDAIHASPPCQPFTDLQKQNKRSYPELIVPTRELLADTGLPYVIENVEGAPLHDPIVLCGTMFPGLRVLRHRLFETNFPIEAPSHPRHPLVFTYDKRKAHYGKLDQNTSFVQVTGGGNCTIANARDAMGIDWMTKAEINEAIPPAYSEYVGKALRGHLG